MTPSSKLNEKAIFNVARAITSDEARSDYLQQVCGDDPDMVKRVQALLEGLEKQESFLKSPAVPAPTTAPSPISERPGALIGYYKILQEIGQGGFGVVYMAEQIQPVQRKVALKIIKPGMDTRSVIARFEAERQALALMDHPNIAHVFDGGTTESGRPYFVMELVKGIPITKYCDEVHLSIRERLQLFSNVCQAVQHAHQKGIIHRDIKPSNVLVTQADGTPVVKVIDFGVAKAIQQRLTEKTLFTAFGEMIGTPQYMSPEQAEMNCLDVDTRSDIYSLGVLLYELLTGTTPLDAQILRSAGYGEIQRLIREEESPKPSTRLSSFGQKLPIVARQRSVSPNVLPRLIRGDLDWIVLKSLEKDRNRRYETADSFRADVRSYLENKPVTACRPSTLYRLAKFTRRNRAAVIASGFILCLVLSGLFGLTKSYIDQYHLIVDLREQLFRNALALAMQADSDAEELITRAEQAGVSEARINMLKGQLLLYQGHPGEAVDWLEKAVTCEEEVNSANSIMSRGMRTAAYHFCGEIDRWLDEASALNSFSDRDLANASAEDLLFWAQATCVLVEPDRVQKYLNRSLDDKVYPLSLAVQAEARTWGAIHNASASDIRIALDNVEAAELMMPDNPYVLHTKILANYVAGILDQDDRPLDERIQLAREMAKQVENEFPEYPHARMFAGSYLEFLGDLGEACRHFRNIPSKNPVYPSMEVVALYSNGRFQAARDAATDLTDLRSGIYVFPIWLETEDGRARCRDLYDACISASASGDTEYLQAYVLSILLFLGQHDEARDKAQEWLGNSIASLSNPTFTESWEYFEHSKLEFLAGDIVESELLERAKWSKLTKGDAHWLIGAHYLSKGDRQQARQCFACATEYRANWFISRALAAGHLLQMEDESWPDWIPDGSGMTERDSDNDLETAPSRR